MDKKSISLDEPSMWDEWLRLMTIVEDLRKEINRLYRLPTGIWIEPATQTQLTETIRLMRETLGVVQQVENQLLSS